MKAYLIRGVPMSMQRDGWWLNPPDPSVTPSDADSPLRWRLGVLVALIALADALFWETAPGLSLALFSVVCVLAALSLLPRPVPPRQTALALGVTGMSVLPVVELVQPLSILFLMLGLPLAVVILSGRPVEVWRKAVARFWWVTPVQALLDGAGTLGGLGSAGQDADWRHVLRGWALPLGVGLVFAALLLQANPVLEQVVFDWNAEFPPIARILLWLGIALVIWPVLGLHRFGQTLAPDAQPTKMGPRRLPRMINADAILRSLVLFNLLFVVQNAMDMAFLAGGVSLPDGMTYAEYAHRGAYPLLALALLSGGFALLARPFITLAPVLRALLLIWVAQTIWLTCSSLLRLDLYVEAYGLTRLRLAAGIWMGMVAAGLGMILWQIGQGRSNRWLLKRVAGLGLVVIYGCCFFSFDRAIATYNLTYDVPLDRTYLCRLGEAAAPVIHTKTGRTASDFCWNHHHHREMQQPKDWREWGFRNARVRRSLAGVTSIDLPAPRNTQ